jgi:Protein of unknown function (DUF3592)
MVAPGAAMLGVGLLTAYRSGRAVQRVAGSQRWPSTTGRIIASGVYGQGVLLSARTGGGYSVLVPTVEYVYEVDGVEHRGHTIGFDQSYMGADRRNLRRDFPVGRSVPVYYHPADAGRSVLIPGGRARPFELVFDVLLIIVGALWLIGALTGQ